MANDPVEAGVDEPARDGDDHAQLLSELDSHDLASAVDVVDASESDVFAFADDADPDDTFPQSVASGGPTPTGVILWTRVAPDAFDPEKPLAVQVATDDSFETIVYDGVVTESDRIAAHDYTVKVDLDGRLDPDTEYAYRFVYDDTASRTGHCQTLPRPEDSPESMRLAVLTCQNYLNGYLSRIALRRRGGRRFHRPPWRFHLRVRRGPLQGAWLL